MKRFTPNKQYVTVALYAVGVLVVATLFGLAVFNFGEIAAFVRRAFGAIQALPYGIVMALLLYPFLNVFTRFYSRLFERKKPHPRLVGIFSMLTVYIGMLLVLAIILIGVIPPFIDTVGELSTLITSSLGSMESWVRGVLSRFSFTAEFGDAMITHIKALFSDIVTTDLATLATSFLGSFVGETFDILVGIIISIYLLSGRKLIGAICGKVVAALFPSGGAHRISMFIKRLYSNTTEFIVSRILSALFLGVTSYLLFRVFGIPFYALLALIIMIFNLFPVFGTIFSFLICGLVLLITRPIYTLPVLGILVVLEIVDNLVIEPHTMVHKALRPNIGVTIVLMLCGFALGGVMGAMVAIPVFATIQNALRAFTIHLLNRRHLPTAIEDYAKLDAHAYIHKAENAGSEAPRDTASGDATDK